MRLRFIEPVRKARKAQRTPKRLQALTSQMNRANELSLLGGIRKFKARIKPEESFEAWRTGNYQKVLEVVPWLDLREDLAATVSDSHRSAFEKVSEFAIPRLPEPVKESLRFDTGNSRITRWLNTRTADLVMNIDQTSKQSIQQAVTASFNRALTPRQVAQTIKDSIGLLPQSEKALRKYSDGLIARGYTLDNMYKLSGAYADRLLNQRAQTIARTETKFALNRGQLAVWQSAQSQGLLGRDATKTWIVDGRPCETCEPMDGVTVPLNEPWVITTPTGSYAVEIPTDSHPNCMCDMILDSGSTEQAIEENQPQEEEQNDEAATEE